MAVVIGSVNHWRRDCLTMAAVTGSSNVNCGSVN
jgi:hypothetical protein